MATIDEALFEQSSLNATLRAGIESISQDQVVEFTRYVKVILPLDGFVFWVKADLLAPGAAPGLPLHGAPPPGQPRTITSSATVIRAKGSLHFFSEKVQEEENTYWVNRVVFTSEIPLHPGFSTIGDDELYVGLFANPRDSSQKIRFAFARQEGFYAEAGIWHYRGEAIYPFMESQVVDSLESVSARQVVSNSLPLWLALNNYDPFYGFGNHIPLYPSHLVSSNIHPPFGSVHVDPRATQALASAPTLGARSEHDQLCRDSVRVTLYGVRHDDAMSFLDCVVQRSADYNELGMMNVPTVRDEKRDQAELNVIAMKKVVEFEVSYLQSVARNVSRQIICQAIPTYENVWPGGYLS